MYTERAKEIKRLCTQREQRKEKSEIKWSEKRKCTQREKGNVHKLKKKKKGKNVNRVKKKRMYTKKVKKKSKGNVHRVKNKKN